MEGFFKEIQDAKEEHIKEAKIISKEKDILVFISKPQEILMKSLKAGLGALECVAVLLEHYLTPEKGSDKPKDDSILKNIQNNLQNLINPFLTRYGANKICRILRFYFKAFANDEKKYIDGLLFFSKFEDLIKDSCFNPVKAFLFYFAYQKHRYGSQMVKELLNQNLINANITDPKDYLDFCMYSFYKGMYFLEKKNYFMCAYIYTVPLTILFSPKTHFILLNEFNIQMIKSMPFLKHLTDFNFVQFIFEQKRGHRDLFSSLKGEGVLDLTPYIEYLKIKVQDDKELIKFYEFYKNNEKNIIDSRLNGLKEEAFEACLTKVIIKKMINFKKLSFTELLEEFNGFDPRYILLILKKKTISGEINIRFDEVENVIEVFDVRPDSKVKVEETQKNYQMLLDCTQNLFCKVKKEKQKNLDSLKLNEEDKLILNKLQKKDEEDDLTYGGFGAGGYDFYEDIDEMDFQ